MSPSWRDQLILGLAPDRLSAIRVGRGSRPRVRARAHQRIDVGDDVGWSGAFAALGEFLEPLAKGRLAVHAILSNHWVHYAVLPPTGDLRSDAERRAMAAMVFEERFGSDARDWLLRWSLGARTSPTLASGIAPALLDSLRSALPEHVRLAACQPALMPALNRLRLPAAADDDVFALAEPGRVVVAHRRRGQWSDALSRRTQAKDTDTLPRLLGELAVLKDIPSGTTVWLQDVAGNAALPAGTSWVVERVPSGDGQLADLGRPIR